VCCYLFRLSLRKAFPPGRIALDDRPHLFLPEQVKNLSDKLEKVLKNVFSAPVYVAVLVDSQVQHPDYILYDGTLAAGTMMIAARALGYGTGFFTTFLVIFESF